MLGDWVAIRFGHNEERADSGEQTGAHSAEASARTTCTGLSNAPASCPRGRMCPRHLHAREGLTVTKGDPCPLRLISLPLQPSHFLLCLVALEFLWAFLGGDLAKGSRPGDPPRLG